MNLVWHRVRRSRKEKNVNTPIRDFIKANRKKEHRFYMPGHKGRGYIARDDVTEIEGADVLYRPEGIIAESEKNAARIFGAARTVFSCEGSSGRG